MFLLKLISELICTHFEFDQMTASHGPG